MGDLDDAPVESDVTPDPPPPSHLGAALEPSLLADLHRHLLNGHGQLSDVYRAMLIKPGAGPTELLPLTDCANTGVVGNRRIVVFAILDGTRPKAPSVARQAASTVRSMLKTVTDDVTKAHLADVLATLESVATSTQAVEEETHKLEADSAELAGALKTATGIYVYTYPHYWRHPYTPGSERTLLKVGRTMNQAWSRVITQARQTGMPEDPMLLRVYTTEDPVGTEKKFHMLLDTAEHRRSAGVAVGKEWFLTTIEYCDAIAAALELEVVKGSNDES